MGNGKASRFRGGIISIELVLGEVRASGGICSCGVRVGDGHSRRTIVRSTPLSSSDEVGSTVLDVLSSKVSKVNICFSTTTSILSRSADVALVLIVEEFLR